MTGIKDSKGKSSTKSWVRSTAVELISTQMLIQILALISHVLLKQTRNPQVNATYKPRNMWG